jgi:hypothetical protein
LSPDQTRIVLRHLASEINRTYLRAYGWAQVVLGAVLFLLLWREHPRDTTGLVGVGVMLALVMVMMLSITPEIVMLGRRINFVPRNPPPPEMARFRLLHGAFTGLDGVKLLAATALLARWVVPR